MKLLTAHELCDTLRISRSTLHRLKKAGLPAISGGRLTRFDQDASLKWFAQHSQQIKPATTLLFVGAYECQECHYEATISEPTDVTRLQECPRCASRERPIRVDVPAV